MNPIRALDPDPAPPLPQHPAKDPTAREIRTARVRTEKETHTERVRMAKAIRTAKVRAAKAREAVEVTITVAGIALIESAPGTITACSAALRPHWSRQTPSTPTLVVLAFEICVSGEWPLTAAPTFCHATILPALMSFMFAPEPTSRVAFGNTSAPKTTLPPTTWTEDAVEKDPTARDPTAKDLPTAKDPPTARAHPTEKDPDTTAVKATPTERDPATEREALEKECLEKECLERAREGILNVNRTRKLNSRKVQR